MKIVTLAAVAALAATPAPADARSEAHSPYPQE